MELETVKNKVQKHLSKQIIAGVVGLVAFALIFLFGEASPMAL